MSGEALEDEEVPEDVVVDDDLRPVSLSQIDMMNYEEKNAESCVEKVETRAWVLEVVVMPKILENL